MVVIIDRRAEVDKAGEVVDRMGHRLRKTGMDAPALWPPGDI